MGLSASAQVAPVAGPEFQVASVHVDRTDGPSATNVPLTANDFYPPNGGVLSAHRIALIHFIAFAYKLNSDQEHALAAGSPAWVSDEPLSIEARTDREPDKDTMRGMMRTLLADRFRLVAHRETRSVPVLALVPASPGKLGPDLQPYLPTEPCKYAPTGSGPPRTQGTRAASTCNGFGFMPPSRPGLRHVAGTVPLSALAGALGGLGNLGRPVVDRTGLSGAYSFSLEWLPEGPSAESSDTGGASFVEALREQLGLKLERSSGVIEFLVLDHVEQPAAN